MCMFTFNCMYAAYDYFDYYMYSVYDDYYDYLYSVYDDYYDYQCKIENGGCGDCFLGGSDQDRSPAGGL